ncbi:MAG: pyridoxal phosphate-dependent aminotransferase [bacterium]|nr:pyridoxal phosphate-dependent aminotransferase [bacterium]
MRIADRMRGIDASGIRKAFELARRVEDPIDLSIGQPDYGPPDELVEDAAAALRSGFHRYSLTHGFDELRAEVRRHLRERKGIEPEEVMITSGVAGGILLSFLALLNPGDRVVIPDPYFVIYKHMCRLVGAEAVFLDTYPDFRITAERLDRAFGRRGARAVVLNNPSNPTGNLIGGDGLREIADLCGRRDALIISDEVYDFFAYDASHESTARHAADALVLGGHSKTFGIPGWRVGYAAGPAAVIREMVKLQQYSFVCAPSPLQRGVLRAYAVDMGGRLAAYRRKRDLVCAGLEGKYSFVRPGGAFYLFPEAPGGSGAAFVERALGRRLILVPGAVFSERDTHFRLSFAAPDEVLRRGIEALRELA